MFSVDPALNTLWLALSLGALLYFVRLEMRRSRSGGRQRLGRTLAMLLACVILFPCVSASDDSVRLQYFQSAHPDTQHSGSNHSNTSPEKSLATLVRLLDALESVQVSVVWSLAVALYFFAIATVLWRTVIEAFLPRRSGRAPPTILFAA